MSKVLDYLADASRLTFHAPPSADLEVELPPKPNRLTGPLDRLFRLPRGVRFSLSLPGALRLVGYTRFVSNLSGFRGVDAPRGVNWATLSVGKMSDCDFSTGLDIVAFVQGCLGGVDGCRPP